MFAHKRINVPATREANAITTRSLSFGSSTKRIWEANSARSIADQINTSVSGLSATVARMPSEVRTNIPIQLTVLGKLLRTTDVIMMARHNVARLTANAHAMPSAMNVGDCEKSNVGCQMENC